MSIIALNQFKKDPTMKGKGFAIAGTVISAVSVGMVVLGAVINIVLLMFGFVKTGIFGIITGIINEMIKESFASFLLF